MILGFTTEKQFKTKLKAYRNQRKAEVHFRDEKKKSENDAQNNKNWTALDTPVEHREWFKGRCNFYELRQTPF